MSYRLGKNIANNRNQTLCALSAESVGASFGMNSCAKQGFVRINVANSAKYGLIQQNCLDRGSATETFGRQRRGESISPEARCTPFVSAEFDAPEHPNIIVKKRCAVEL